MGRAKQHLIGQKTECAKCSLTVCESNRAGTALPACPTNAKQEILKKGLTKSKRPDLREFARQAAIQQFDSFTHLPEGRVARSSRIEETIQFAKKMGYRKLGLAFCSGLRGQSELFNQLLEKHGFEVVSVCCKVGGFSKEHIGITDEHKLRGPGSYEVMCNPITQAEILNEESTEFNIVIGLCVGHDALFLRHADALSTVLIAKDRVLAHNPIAALHASNPCYKRLAEAKEETTI